MRIGGPRSAVVCVLLAAPLFLMSSGGRAAEDTCLVFIGESLGTPGNNYSYRVFSQQNVTIAKGDVPEYEIFQPAVNPSPQCGLDIAFVGGSLLRSSQCQDKAGKTLTLYGNGKVVASAPMTQPIGPGPSPIHIGFRRGGSCFFAGAVDEFILVPRALTAAEVAHLAQRPAPPVPKADAP